MIENTTHKRHDRLTWTASLTLGGIACFAALIGLACQGNNGEARTTSPSRPVTVDSHGLHAVRNADLRTIMNKLHALHLNEISDEIEITGELQRDICDVATIAESLAADAQLMPLLLDDATMTDEARRVMVSMSSRLHFEAEELAAAANRNDLPGIRNNLQTMLDTCSACHHEFRAPTLVFAGGGIDGRG